jgi:hypothetical protein
MAQGIRADDTPPPLDSLGIFQLLDSLMQLEEWVDEPLSRLAIRTGYNSNINATGSPFELGQYGISVGSTFYHKSGLFADASAYFSNQNTPDWYLTTGSLGYTFSLPKWSFVAEYRKSFYRINDDFISPFPRVTYNYIDGYSLGIHTNNLTGTFYFEHKKLNLRFDYSLLLESGELPAHRFWPTLSFNFTKRKWLKTEKVSFYPSVSWLYGIGPVQEYRKLYRTRLEALYRIRNGLPLLQQVENQQSGTQNIALTVPIAVFWKRWGAMASYTYNFPKTLPGETYVVENGGYFTCSVVRYIDIKNRRKSYGI